MTPDGDGVADSVSADTVGDGADTLVPPPPAGRAASPSAAAPVTSPGHPVYSLILTIVLLVIFAAGLAASLLGGLDALFAEEVAYALLVGEYGGAQRWLQRQLQAELPPRRRSWSSICSDPALGPDHRPSLSVALPALSALRLLRATRILRLSRLFSKETFTKLVQALRGSSTAVEVSEVTRVV